MSACTEREGSHDVATPASPPGAEDFARLAAIVNSSRDAIVSTDPEGIVTSWNPGAEEMFGFSAAEMVGKPLSTLVPPGGHDEKEGILERLTKDGRRLWVSLKASPLRDASGNVTGTCAIMRDVTEARHAETALRASEAHFRSLADTMPQQAWMAAGDGKSILWCNQRCFDYTGKTFEELQGDGWRKLHDPALLPAIVAKWRQCVATGTPFECECPLRGADGTFRLFLTRGVPVKDEQGRVLHWFATNTDITDRIETEDALRESEARFRHLADAAPVIIWLSGPDKLFNYFNQAWLDFTGHSMDEEIDIDWSENIHPDDLERSLENYKNSFDAKQPFAMEYRLRHHTGEYRWLLDRGVPRVAADGTFEGFIGAAIDIHDQKMAAESIRLATESASRAKDEFLAALSHELRTPLSPVLMLASAMEHAPDLPEQVRADCGMIRKNVELEARLIDDLLDLTRITRGKLMLRFENLDPHPLIEHTLEILRSDLHAKQIQVEATFCTPTPYVSADSVRLQQVFWNVLKNAVKFTPAGGHIFIRTYSDGTNWRAEFADTGLGITAEEMPQIFTAFSQGKEASEPRFGGVGLGLAITAHIVHEHRGLIRAESAGRGHGSTFYLDLPHAPMTHSGRIKLPTPAPRRQPMRILLVEDHEASRSTLQRLLGRRGHTVATAASLAQARALAESHAFDVVVSDLGLPDGSGHQLMRELSQKHRLCGVALSGYGMASDLKHSQEAGFGDHLIKPVDVNTLEQAILRVWTAGQIRLKAR